VAAGVVLVIGCAAHAREPLGRARRRWARRVGGQPEVRQDLLGVFVYKVNEHGALVSLRAFWEFDKMMAAMMAPSTA
jgi:hypothetical protein